MAATHRPLLLLVEDNPRWRDILQRELGSEYLIKVAFSKTEAENSLDVLYELGSPPTVCVLDPTIPESPPFLEDEAEYKVGEGLAKKLQSHSIPFVILTARPGPARVIRAFEELGVLGFFRKHKWTEEKERLRERIREITPEAPAIEACKEGSEESSVDATLKGALWPFFLALAGLPLVIFALLTGVVLLIPEGLVIAVIGAGITLVILLVASLALFINRITGEQFTDIVRELLKQR